LNDGTGGVVPIATMTIPIQPAVGIALVCSLALTVELPAASGDWPQFRGTGALGMSDAKGAPLTRQSPPAALEQVSLPAERSLTPQMKMRRNLHCRAARLRPRV